MMTDKMTETEAVIKASKLLEAYKRFDRTNAKIKKQKMLWGGGGLIFTVVALYE